MYVSNLVHCPLLEAQIRSGLDDRCISLLFITGFLGLVAAPDTIMLTYQLSPCLPDI